MYLFTCKESIELDDHLGLCSPSTVLHAEKDWKVADNLLLSYAVGIFKNSEGKWKLKDKGRVVLFIPL